MTDKAAKGDVPARNVKMTIEYDGTNYCGWQVQARDITVQAVVEKALARILGEKIHAAASGRTDAGVHALGQVVSVRAHFPMDDTALLKGMNSLLPKDIAIKTAVTVPPAFHARKDAKWKKYRYMIHYSPVPSPLSARTSWHIPYGLKINAMRKAAGMLVGRHDFASFMGPRSSVKTTVREIYLSSIRREGEKIIYEVTGNGFLKNMVRGIVGTLVEIGRGRIPPEEMKNIVDAKNRKAAGPTAPAHGLFLVEVGY